MRLSWHSPQSTTWWLWAALMAIGCAQISDSLTLVGLWAITSLIAYAHRMSHRQWKSFLELNKFAAFIVVTRVALQLIFGSPFGSDVLFRLPSIQFPSWFTGVRFGGVVTSQSLTAALHHGFTLAVTIALIATAATVTSLSRVLRQLPASLQTFGSLILIAVSFVPNIFDDVERVQRTQRWRGRSQNRFQQLGRNITTVTDDALRRSVTLTGSMVTRGYVLEATASPYLIPALTSLVFASWLVVSNSEYRALIYLLVAIALATLALHFRAASHSQNRTHFSLEEFGITDVLLLLTAVIIIVIQSWSIPVTLLLATFPLLLQPSRQRGDE